MGVVGQILSSVAGIVSLVCFILVLVQMFQRGQTGLGIACIVLVFCCGIGGLIAFIYGWMNNREWGITTIMWIWTAAIIVSIIGNIMSPVDYSALQHQFGR